MNQQPSLSAKSAISSFCQVLASSGISGLDPESVRQAKFNGFSAVSTLWRILHDLVILQLTCSPSAHLASAMDGLWSTIRDELFIEGDLQAQEGLCQPLLQLIPAPARLMVTYYLRQWGCPEALVNALTASPGGSHVEPCDGKPGAVHDRQQTLFSQQQTGARVDEGPSTSRSLLLALSWLAAEDRIFNHALYALEEEGHDHTDFLPPYTKDTSGTRQVGLTYWAAVREAQAYRTRIHSGLAALLDTSASQHVAFMTGRPGPFDPPPPDAAWSTVHSAAQMGVMMLGKTRSRLLALQSSEDARSRLNLRVQAAASSASLSAHDLHLIAHPKLMQQHTSTLLLAAKNISEQEVLTSSAHLFFQWCLSVVKEEGKSGGAGTNSHKTAAPLNEAKVEPMPALASLPQSDSAAARKLLLHLQRESKSALQDAQPIINKDTASQKFAMYAPPERTHGSGKQTRGQTDISIQHFVRLARTALGDDVPEKGTGLAGQVLEKTGSAKPSPKWALPPDISAMINERQEEHVTHAAMSHMEETTLKEAVASCSWDLLDSRGMPIHKGYCNHANVRGLGDGQNMDGGGEAQRAEDETQRLLGLTLTVARSLAKVRAGHKQALQSWVKELPGSHLVTGL